MKSSQNVDAIGDGVAEDSEQAAILNENEMNNNNNNSPAVPLSNNHKFHGVSGEVGDVKNLPERDNPAQIYFKARFDSNKDGKKGRASSVLFKTAYYPYSTRQHIGVPFQHKGGISSHMYLILEAKGKGKTDTIDHAAISFGELFAGNKYVSRWLQMDNGGCIHVTLTCEEIENIVESSGRTYRSRLSIRRNKSVEQNV